MRMIELRGRCLNPGHAKAKLYTIPHPVSFYGELEKGFRENIVLLIESSRGSTVAPYVIYRLAKRGKAPMAILVWSTAEPMIVAGCVLAGIPLADRLGVNAEISLEELSRTECMASISCGKRGGSAVVSLRCR